MAQACGHPDGGGQPDPSRRGQPLDLVVAIALEDGACAQKPHARDDALDHAAGFRRFDADLLRDQHEQCRSHRNEHVRAHAGILACMLALPAQHSAQ